MTTSELKTLIASSPEPDKYNAIKVVFEFKYLNYKNEVTGLSAIHEFVSQQIDGFKSIGENKLPTIVANSLNYFNRILKTIEQFSISKESFDQNGFNYSIRNLHNSINQNGNYYLFR